MHKSKVKVLLKKYRLQTHAILISTIDLKIENKK